MKTTRLNNKLNNKEIPITFTVQRQQIVGILHFPKRNKKVPLIILCHGWNGNRLGTHDGFFVKAAREFVKNGFAVLRFDFRGSGDSEGNPEDQTISSMVKDLKNIVNQISNSSNFLNVNKKSIGLIGYSRGALVTLLEATKNKKIRCLVWWMGTSGAKESFAPMWIEEIKRKKIVYAKGIILTRNYIRDYLKYDPSKIVRNLKTPLLLLYGEQDNVIPPSAGLKIYKLIKAPKELIILKKLDHFFSGVISKKQAIKITLKWLRKWLK